MSFYIATDLKGKMSAHYHYSHAVKAIGVEGLENAYGKKCYFYGIVKHAIKRSGGSILLINQKLPSLGLEELSQNAMRYYIDVELENPKGPRCVDTKD